jgi:hypothetical protein
MAYTPRPMKDVLADVRKGTGAGARRTSQEELDVSRVRASGATRKNAPRGPSGENRPVNPELQAFAKAEAESRAQRWVRGVYERKGRAPGYVLSHEQFAEFKGTGSWSGEPRMPTPEEYGRHSFVPEDKEYT